MNGKQKCLNFQNYVPIVSLSLHLRLKSIYTFLTRIIDKHSHAFIKVCHNLEVEKGRWQRKLIDGKWHNYKIPVEERLCIFVQVVMLSQNLMY